MTWLRLVGSNTVEEKDYSNDVYGMSAMVRIIINSVFYSYYFDIPFIVVLVLVLVVLNEMIWLNLDGHMSQSRRQWSRFDGVRHPWWHAAWAWRRLRLRRCGRGLQGRDLFLGFLDGLF